MMPSQPVTLTPRAAGHIRKLMPSPESGLRIGLKQGGCAGMEYTMEVAETAGSGEIEIIQDGARVFLAPMAEMFLIGTEIDYVATLLEAGFKFRNPNVAEACGCGESISFSNPRQQAKMS